MMEKLFLQIINMSITSSYVILFIILIRLFLNKLPKILSYGLWSIGFLRLILPFSFESIYSIISINTQTIPKDIIYRTTPEINSGIKAVDSVINKVLPEVTSAGASVNPIQIWIGFGAFIWAAGLFLLLIYSIISTLKLSNKLKSAKLLYANIYKTDNIQSPFVFGLIKPRIYLPNNLSEDEKSYIIEHEKTHIKRKDHIIKFASFIITSIHWFNPLVWSAFYLMGEDMELSCDESVIKKMGYGIKKDYSTSLLSLSTGRKIISGSPIAFGENNTRGRIKNILNYKKPKTWVIGLCIVLTIGLALGLLSNQPKKIETADKLYNLKNTKIGDNSKVSEIINLLKLPEELQYESIELFTKEEPYGLKINFKADTDVQMSYVSKSSHDSWLSQFLVLFSLIDNLDYIIYGIDDGNSNIDVTNFSRNVADDITLSTLGYRALEASKNKERFRAFYEMWGNSSEGQILEEDNEWGYKYSIEIDGKPIADEDIIINRKDFKIIFAENLNEKLSSTNSLDDREILSGQRQDHLKIIGIEPTNISWTDGTIVTALIYEFEDIPENTNFKIQLSDELKEKLSIKNSIININTNHNKALISNELIMDIGSSSKFDKREIEDAVKVVKDNFDFPASTLTRIWYSEEESEKLTKFYLENGRGSVNGAQSENVIVLLTNFDVDDSGDNPVLNPNSTYDNYNWILIRDNKTSKWKIDDRGY
jgi:beta-lactamase regulating signal transducer with metallopeptidase domain